MSNPKQILNNIQMLRAFAAILVIMHHTLPHYEAMGTPLHFISIISSWGFIGVDIFFIISGYIITYTTFHKERNFSEALQFIKHRLYRIYLGYWPFFLIMFLLILRFYPDKMTSLDIWGSLTLFETDMHKLILPVSWSLSYELYFYALFTITLLLSSEYLYILIPLFISVILSIALYHLNTHRVISSFIYSPFLIEFFMGSLLFLYQKYFMKFWMIPIALFSIFLLYSYGITHDYKNGILRVLTFGTGALFLLILLLILENKKIFRAGSTFVLLGNSSYTLYLSHLILLEFFYFTGLRTYFQTSGDIMALVGYLLIISITIIFSIFYYKKIEKPLYLQSINWQLRKKC